MKLLTVAAALLPVAIVALHADAQISTKTIVQPVATETHTNIVFVTATAGAATSTGLLSISGYNNGTSGALSTVHLTSSVTTTTTEVVIPPNVTTTVTTMSASFEKSSSVPTSCIMQTPDTLTVTVTETSTPVITRSVYPLPATNITSNTESHAPIFATVSSPSSVINRTQPMPPYRNATATNTMASNTSVYDMPLISKVVGGAPDNILSFGAPTSKTSYPVNTEHGSITSTEGVFPTSAGRIITPPRMFVLLAKILSFVGHTKAQLANPTIMANNVENSHNINATDSDQSIVYVTSTGTAVVTVLPQKTTAAPHNASVSSFSTVTVTISKPLSTIVTYTTTNTVITSVTHKSFYQHTETLLTTMTQNATGFEKVVVWDLFVGGLILAMAM